MDRIRTLAAGVIAGLLLLPIPAYAYVIYNSGAWSVSNTGTSPNPFASVSGTTSNVFLGFGVPTLTFDLNSTSYTNLNRTVVLTSPASGSASGALVGDATGFPFFLNNNHTATGTWSTTSNIYQITSGSVTVQVAFLPSGGGSANNMFAGSGASWPPTNPGSVTLANGDYQIRVTLTFSGATFRANTTPFTLTFGSSAP